MKQSSLGSLAVADYDAPNLDVSAVESTVIVDWLEKMVLIRLVEEAIGELAASNEAATPCHLGIGQEAVAVGVSAALSERDRVFGGHRSHSQYLALGGSVDALMAEVLGRRTGASRGLGGSMHLYDGKVGFHGSVPIVAGTIPIAVGAALAAKLEGTDIVAVCFFGDGAAEEGVLHEALNLAAVQELPVLFVCENNLFSSHLDIDARQPDDRVGRFGEAHRVETRTIDGNDVVVTAKTSRQLVATIRGTKRPAFLEAVTFRHRGHVGPNEDIDVGVHRTMTDVIAWKERDPIKRLEEALTASNMVSQSDIERIWTGQLEIVSRAVERARNAPRPEPSCLLDYVYQG